MLMAIVAALSLAAAGYAQLRIPRHTAGTVKVMLTRAVLIIVGIAFGYVATAYYSDTQGLPALLVFLAGFGLVHIPAAFILFIKREGGAGKS